MATRTCPDCSGATQPIQILDAAESSSRRGTVDVQLGYASPEAPIDLFTKKVAREGVVEAVICTDCGRILLYGHPFKKA